MDVFEKHNEDYLKSELVQNLTFRDSPLTYKEVNNGKILPFRGDYSSTTWGIGGVIDSEGYFVSESVYKNGWSTFGGYYEYSDYVNVIDKPVIYLGVFFKHWGHFLLDLINRMWIILSDFKFEYVVYLGNEDMDGNYLEFMEMLGVPKEKLLRIDTVTKFKKIIIPELSYVKTSYYTKEYLNMFEKVRNKCMLKHVDEKIRNSKYVYFSRIFYSKGLRAKEFGEKSIEKTFLQNGYLILRPELLSLSEQIIIWNTAKKIVCINGTIPLNVLFSDSNIEVIVLNKTSKPHENLFLVEKIKKADIKYVDIYDKRFTNKDYSLGRGPFLMGITDGFRNFCKLNDYHIVEEPPVERVINILRFKMVALIRMIKK